MDYRVLPQSFEAFYERKRLHFAACKHDIRLWGTASGSVWAPLDNGWWPWRWRVATFDIWQGRHRKRLRVTVYRDCMAIRFWLLHAALMEWELQVNGRITYPR